MQVVPHSQRASRAERFLVRPNTIVLRGTMGKLLRWRSSRLTAQPSKDLTNDAARTCLKIFGVQFELHQCASALGALQLRERRELLALRPHNPAKIPKRSNVTRSILGLKSFALTTRLLIRESVLVPNLIFYQSTPACLSRGPKAGLCRSIQWRVC